MIATTARFAAFAAILLASANAQTCNTAPYGSCGSNAGVTCCPAGQYCQPWDAGFFQCIVPPAKCSQQFTNIDFYGNDIKAVYGIQPEACCDECTKTAGCTSYTFINSAPGSPACYLKSGNASDRRTVIGAVSGLVNGGSTSAPTSAPTTAPPTTAPTTAPPTSTPTPQPSDGCATAPFGSCGSNAGTKCCPAGQYCQPWDAGFFQCIAPPAKCSQQFTNIDFYGNDIKAVYGIQPEACCDECTKTAGCTSYTFINSAPGSPACYLKSGNASDRRTVIGAVSGLVNGGSTSAPTSAPTTAPPTTAPTTAPPTPSPTNTCTTAPYASCGSNAGTTCCPTGQYCQPWDANFFQCIAPPAKCSAQLTNMDFYGNDIKTVYVSLPSLCCDECAKTAGCKAYTYINSAPGQPVCYLKSAAGTPTPLVGAVAGKLN